MHFRSWLETEDYRGLHSAPGPGSGSPLHDLSATYPEDIYGPNGVIYYGTREPWDNESISIIQKARNRPNMRVKIYRAVPSIITSQDKANDLEKQKKYILKYGKIPPYINTHLDSSAYYDLISTELEKIKVVDEPRVRINSGDWVTISKVYAVQHGRSHLKNRFRILSKTVPARTLYTNGDSIHEWGYCE
jgi:hypothetical protein